MTQNAIMQKQFFVVVPYDSIQVPQVGKDIAEKVLGLFKKKTEKENAEAQSTNQEEMFEQLSQRVDQVINGLNQLGLRVVPLNDEELIELFYNLYNPATVEKRGVEMPQNG